MRASDCSDRGRSSISRGRWLSAAALRLHLALVTGVAGCALAGWFELTRALAGRTVAWVYVFEWPLFAVIGSYMWWRLLTESRPGRPRRSPTSDVPDELDEGLLAWRGYLERLHAEDPPGGPPSR